MRNEICASFDHETRFDVKENGKKKKKTILSSRLHFVRAMIQLRQKLIYCQRSSYNERSSNAFATE